MLCNKSEEINEIIKKMLESPIKREEYDYGCH